LVDTTSETPLGCTYTKYDIRRKRKGYRPTKSAARLDPSFKGATVSLMTHVKDAALLVGLYPFLFLRISYFVYVQPRGVSDVVSVLVECLTLRTKKRISYY
jgi:hypothetical protein